MRRRTLALLVLVYAFVVAIGAWGAHRANLVQQDALERRLDARSVTAARFVEAYVTDVYRRETELARLRLRGDLPEAEFQQLIREHGFDAAVVVDARGRAVAVAPPDRSLIGTELASRYGHLRTALAGRPAISDVVPAASDGRPVIGFAVPFEAGGERRVFSGAYRTARTPLAPYLANITELRGSQTYLVDSAGVVVAYGTEASGHGGSAPGGWPRTLETIDARLADAVAAAPGAADGTVHSGEVELAGDQSRWTVATVPGTPWRLVSTVPSAVLYETAAATRWTPWAAVGLLVLLGLVVLAMLVRDEITTRRVLHSESRLAAVLAATGDAIVSRDLDGTVLSWNHASERLYGWSEAEALGRDVDELLPPASDAEERELAAAMRIVHSGRRVDSLEKVRRRKDGTPVRLQVSLTPLTGPGGEVIGVVSSARDVTTAHEQARQLREAEERFRLAFDAVPTGMLLTTLDATDPGRIMRANSAVCWMLGYTEAELQQRTFGDITHPEDRDSGIGMLEAFSSGEKRSLRFEKRYVRGDGQIVWAMVSAAAVNGRGGRPQYVVSQVDDITDRRAERDRLTTLALTDSLTGLSNRFHFDDRLAHTLTRAGRQQVTIGVVYCDLDGFKPVNDELGHDAGDDLLRQVAHRLQSATRPSDTVARLGGDEFAVLCDDLPDAVTAERIADRIRETVEGTYLVAAGTVTIGVSVGLATVDLGATTPAQARDLLRQADQNMYADKRMRHAASRAGGA